jgi:hypothetical protein
MDLLIPPEIRDDRQVNAKKRARDGLNLGLQPVVKDISMENGKSRLKSTY